LKNIVVSGDALPHQQLTVTVCLMNRTGSGQYCSVVELTAARQWSLARIIHEGTGRITETMLREHLPPPGPDSVIFLCGPPPMTDALEATLKGIGYSEQAIILP
jgi:ferredoxin-NADP reductase